MPLEPHHATRFTAIALAHVTREYPNALQHVMIAHGDWASPRELHPIFFGSYDWHSCVHGYWTLARCLRRFPNRPECARVRALFEESFTEAKVEAELAYFQRPSAAAFERPYGWAWLLMLEAELLKHQGEIWALRLAPLARSIAQRLHDFLPIATHPVRAGTHANTAFALTLAFEYAEAADDEILTALLQAKARQWHADDRNAQSWEPSLDDFLSPTLIVAEAMRRALPRDEFGAWFAAYLPSLTHREPASLFTPAEPTLRSDGKIAHLDGLNLSRAWCWRGLASSLRASPALAEIASSAAQIHLEAALPHLTTDYAGAHWLQSFALLALEADA